jgi:hypothetical protein
MSGEAEVCAEGENSKKNADTPSCNLLDKNPSTPKSTASLWTPPVEFKIVPAF